MTSTRLIRHLDEDDLASRTAERLLRALVKIQGTGKVASLCLSDGPVAMEVYQRLVARMELCGVDPGRLELWWTRDYYVPTGSPERVTGPILAAFAERYSFDPARIHPIPAAEASIDAEVAAFNYAKEVEEAEIDICLLQLAPGGLIAGLPPHTAAERVIAVNDPALGLVQISLTESQLSQSAEVWMLACGPESAPAVTAVLNGDTDVPVGRVHGKAATVWLADRAATAGLPYFHCEL
jgi:6-phosphogluconolactonase